MIPRVLYYVFGLTPDFGGKPFGMLHYACIASALAHIRPERCVVAYAYEPDTPWWNRLKPRIDAQRIAVPDSVFDIPVAHYAHRADVWRMQTLVEHGGIYLDADVLVTRPFDELLGHDTVMGLQQDGYGEGLCNAVILAAPRAPFMTRWYDTYRHFRSKGRDEFWDEHSVRIPRRLAAENPGELTVLPTSAFFTPGPSDADIDRLFASPRPLNVSGAYAHHLWESVAWRPFLDGLTLAEVRRRDTAYHHLIRPYLADLPDDFDATTTEAKGEGTRRARGRAQPVLKLLDATVPNMAWRLRQKLR
ncbi:glycosyltransferase family 32 protein [Elioraea sp.]|uniref:glycosyltransferase family 32 protein n=1 Tax=Elioraea sp. TaxID=2185103 RepID=UPI0025BBC273|nr:glycosyltransferase [Elioraea sp.]